MMRQYDTQMKKKADNLLEYQQVEVENRLTEENLENTVKSKTEKCRENATQDKI